MQQTPQYIQTCYDAVAAEYAERFVNELTNKPKDRELLDRFAADVGQLGEVCDLGCGPGHTTAYLNNRGVRVCGIDLSAKLLDEARRHHPNVKFEQGNILSLPRGDDTVAGVAAMYAIVHFTQPELTTAFAEMYRVLQPGGRLLIAFHIGDSCIHVENFLGRPVTLDFFTFGPIAVANELTRVGFAEVEIVERDPYPDVEYPSRRAYLFAKKLQQPV